MIDMGTIREKVYDWKNRLKDRHMLTLVVVLVAVLVAVGLYIYKRERDFRQVSENTYNMAFVELVDYVENVETYLAKSLISSTPEHGAETLTHVWREANLAQSYLARLPIGSQELANTSKFLNQVSDYSYSLSRKNIYNEPLTQEELDNLKQLHNYSVELENTLNQLSADINDGRINWGELSSKGSNVFATEVSNLSQDSFSSLEENFHEYAGLIYDGAFSEHLTSAEKKGLTGDDIEEEQAKQKAIEFIGQDKIKEINSQGLSENTDMPSYDFGVILNRETEKGNSLTISVTKKGGHVVFMNYNRQVEAQTVSEDRAVEIGKNFLKDRNFPEMKETYYLKNEGVITINYAYAPTIVNTQNGESTQVIMYPDLIKLKIALDNAEVLGIETTGYLNSHQERTLPEVKISNEQAKTTINKNLEIQSEGLAIIPTEFQTEIFCWEFKGKVDDTEFLVYINAENGNEEDILVIKETPNGTLTM